MAVRCPVPSRSAYRYVDSIMERSADSYPSLLTPDIMIGGHSKGGNMAAYAAMLVAQHDIENPANRQGIWD